jgi:hypothetical protein
MVWPESGNERINPNIIDSSTGDLCNILITSARKTLGQIQIKTTMKKCFLVNNGLT